MVELRLSRRVSAIKPSATLALTARAQALKAEGSITDIIALTAGEPDFETPLSIRQAAIDALNEGGAVGRYTPAAGMAELRRAVSAKFERDNGLHYPPEQCIVSCGAKHSLFNALGVLIDEGDEVIVPAPYWVSYPEMVRFFGGRAVIVDTSETGFILTPSALKQAMGAKTRALIVNSPGNPSGAVWSGEAQANLAAVLEGTGIAVISDEIYEKLIYDGEHVSFASASSDAFSRTVTVNGVAKAYAMTGWRIGFAAGPLNVIEAMTSLQSHSTSNPTTVSQFATLKALQEDPPELAEWRRAFRARRDYMLGALNQIEGVNCAKPGGAFYVFPDMRQWIGKVHDGAELKDDNAICEALLGSAHVACVPGSAFGAPGFIRMSYAVSDADLKQAVERINKFAAALA